jgi:serine/threonine protein kinase
VSPALNWSFGDYLILHEIDRGQFGTVYAATHPSRQSVALKLIPLDGVDSEEKVEAERQGAILQQRFSRAHANLVPDVFEHQPLLGYYAVAMELIQGEPLTRPIGRGSIPSRRAAEIGLAIARFLEKAHQFTTEIEGLPEIIVHGDLKPAHVLLISDGTIRVLDFGIAKALAARKSATTNKWGSTDYASPERLESGHVNEHADFWSLGIILFEMAAGYRPYRQYEGSPSRLESAIRRQEPRAALPAGADPVLAAIVDKLLAPQPELRYLSAAAIVGDLSAFLDGGSTVAAAERAQASQETIRISPPLQGATRGSSAPTEPLPRHSVVSPPLPRGAGGPPVASTVALPALPRSRRTWTRAKRGARIAAAVIMVMVVVSEGVGCVRAAGLRRHVPALEESDVGAARASYRRLGTPFGWAMGSTREPLRERMVELADRTILAFRAAAPTLPRAQWEQALDCLELAREISPRDSIVAGKRRFVQGRLAWITSRDRAGVDEAIRLLRESARLDPRSPDPYLGLAAIYAYSTRDLPALAEAILEAERRGYTIARRERAEVGDLHKVLADRARARARTLAGAERLEQLQAAAGDYTRCVEYLEGLQLGDSEDSAAVCRRRLRAIDTEVGATHASPVPSVPAGETVQP